MEGAFLKKDVSSGCGRHVPELGSSFLLDPGVEFRPWLSRGPLANDSRLLNFAESVVLQNKNKQTELQTAQDLMFPQGRCDNDTDRMRHTGTHEDYTPELQVLRNIYDISPEPFLLNKDVPVGIAGREISC